MSNNSPIDIYYKIAKEVALTTMEIAPYCTNPNFETNAPVTQKLALAHSRRKYDKTFQKMILSAKLNVDSQSLIRNKQDEQIIAQIKGYLELISKKKSNRGARSDGEKISFQERAENSARNAADAHVANCGEKANIAFNIFSELSQYQDKKIRLERLSIGKPGDHGFVVIGRSGKSELTDLKSWGDAVICDPWFGEVVKVKDLCGENSIEQSKAFNYILEHQAYISSDHPNENFFIGCGHSKRFKQRNRKEIKDYKKCPNKSALHQEENLNVLKCLVSFKIGDVDHGYEQMFKGWGVSAAESVEFARYMLNLAINKKYIELKDIKEEEFVLSKLLQLAVNQSDIEVIVQLLSEYRYDSAFLDHEGFDAKNLESKLKSGLFKFLFSCEFKHKKTTLMLNLIELNSVDENDIKFMQAMISNGDEEVIRALGTKGFNFDQQDELYVSFLENTVRNGSLEKTQAMIEAGVDVNKEYRDYFDCLRDSPLHVAIQSGKIDIVRLLIDNGADVNCSNHYGESPLGYAVNNNNLDMVTALIDKGAKINMEELFSLSCDSVEICNLMVQECQQNLGYVKLLELLVDNKNKIKSKYDIPVRLGLFQKFMYSKILEMAAEQPDVVVVIQLLSEYEYDGHVFSSDGFNKDNLERKLKSDIFRFLFKCECKNINKTLVLNLIELNLVDENDIKLLGAMVGHGDEEVIFALAEKGFDLDRQDDKGVSLIENVVRNGSLQQIKAMIEAGVDLNKEFRDACDRLRASPLHVAIQNGNLDTVKLLIENGAKINIDEALSLSCDSVEICSLIAKKSQSSLVCVKMLELLMNAKYKVNFKYHIPVRGSFFKAEESHNPNVMISKEISQIKTINYNLNRKVINLDTYMANILSIFTKCKEICRETMDNDDQLCQDGICDMHQETYSQIEGILNHINQLAKNDSHMSDEFNSALSYTN